MDGESFEIVFSVYVAILLPWAFLYLHDFISERWISVSRTILYGWVHLATALLPLPYVLYYIFLQRRLLEPDYKEMCAAVTAAVFSVYHSLRTAWGLSQLYSFRRWAVQTALAFECAAYSATLCAAVETKRRRPSLKTEAGKKEGGKKEGGEKEGMSIGSGEEGEVRGGEIGSENPHVPSFRFDTAVGDTTRVGPRGEVRPDENVVGTGDGKGAKEEETKNWCWWWRGGKGGADEDAKQLRRIGKMVDRVLVNSTIVDNEFIASNSPWRLTKEGLLRPLHRKSTFVRWAVVFLAHFGERWLAECSLERARDRGEDREGKSTWAERREEFATRVWATAALRMESRCEGLAREPSGNKGQVSFLEPGEWHKVTQERIGQLFDRKFVVREAYATGTGLPFKYPILDELERDKRLLASFRPLIKEAVESLPTRFYEYVERLAPEDLDWMAVIVSVGAWAGYNEAKTKEQVLGKMPVLSPHDAPVKVLQHQLGVERPLKLSMCAFPQARHGFGLFLWENRSVLQVSARIDNWSSLKIGQQIKTVLQQVPSFAEDGDDFKATYGQPHTPVTSPSSGTGSIEEGGSSKRSLAIIDFHRRLEIRRLRSQLGVYRPQHRLLEQCLSFMGCVMESVRSQLAETIQRARHAGEWYCTPQTTQSIVFPVSEQLCKCLQMMAAAGSNKAFDSTVQERVLWECQNGTYANWWKKWRDPNPQQVEAAPLTFEAITLCLLAFPSLEVVWDDFAQSTATDSSALSFRIAPVGGPTQLWTRIEVNLCTLQMVVGVDGIEKNGSLSVFRWQDWRDAFQGRLKGKSEWQKNHYMRELRINQTDRSIHCKIKPMSIAVDDGEGPVPVFRRIFIWEGWKPFRAGITQFELRHSSLIILGDSMPRDTYQVTDGSLHVGGPGIANRNTAMHKSEAYREATTAALTDASAHLDSLLALNNNIIGDSNDDIYDVIEVEDGGQLIPAARRASLSTDIEPFSLECETGEPPSPSKVVEQAKKQDAVAMHDVAVWMLTGKHGYKKDRNRALRLMERALVLGRGIETASRLVKTLVESSNAEADVNRCLDALELLWRDIARRHAEMARRQTETAVNNRNENVIAADYHTHRMAKLAKLHLKVASVRPRAEILRDLAYRLSTFGGPKEQRTAIILYESAILARGDILSMIELGREHHTSDQELARALYRRALDGGETAAVLLLGYVWPVWDKVEKYSLLELRSLYEHMLRQSSDSTTVKRKIKQELLIDLERVDPGFNSREDHMRHGTSGGRSES